MCNPSRRRLTRGHCKRVASRRREATADGALPTEDDVRRILGSVGAVVEDRLDLLFALMEGKDITRLIAVGREQLTDAASPSLPLALVHRADFCSSSRTVRRSDTWRTSPLRARRGCHTRCLLPHGRRGHEDLRP